MDYGEWVLVTQDCDLFSTPADSGEFIELRPVFNEPGYTRVGIRSAKFAITDEKALCSQSARTMVEARVLSALLESRQPLAEAKRRRWLKTWLGLRYDRPAVPQEFVPLARAVAEAVKRVKERDTDTLVRCVLMDLRDQDGPTVNLYAVIYDAANRDSVEQWLEKVAARVKIGRVLNKQALTEGQISLQVLENTYAADLSQITIDGAAPEPPGVD